MNSSSRFWHIIVLTIALLSCPPTETCACACCPDRGTWRLQSNEPLSGYVLEQIKGIEFASAAQLFLVDGPDPEDQVKGLATISDSYAMTPMAESKQWRLKFRAEDGKSGELILVLPSKVARFAVDIHNGETNFAGQPLLYKEWRLEGRATGNEMFKEGFAAPARYTLIFQGRGNACDSADDFSHWRLEISGKKADYAFFGELTSARPDHAEQRKLVHDAIVRQDHSSTEEEKK
jgi:hypothetical protein